VTCFGLFNGNPQAILTILKLSNSVALDRERTLPTERPPLVSEVSANFCGQRGVAWSGRRIPYRSNLGFLDRILTILNNKIKVTSPTIPTIKIN
jgi:hypothetical protein